MSEVCFVNKVPKLYWRDGSWHETDEGESVFGKWLNLTFDHVEFTGKTACKFVRFGGVIKSAKEWRIVYNFYTDTLSVR